MIVLLFHYKLNRDWLDFTVDCKVTQQYDRTIFINILEISFLISRSLICFSIYQISLVCQLNVFKIIGSSLCVRKVCVYILKETINKKLCVFYPLTDSWVCLCDLYEYRDGPQSSGQWIFLYSKGHREGLWGNAQSLHLCCKSFDFISVCVCV